MTTQKYQQPNFNCSKLKPVHLLLAISIFKYQLNSVLILQWKIYLPSQQAETGNYTVHLLLCITMKLKHLENLARLRCWNYGGGYNCKHAHECCSCLLGKYCCTKSCWCPAAGLLRWVSTNMPSVTPAQVAQAPGSSRSSREGAQERPRTNTDLLAGSAEHYLFRCNNTNLCGLFHNDKMKRIPKNAFPVWLPKPHCKHTVFAIPSDGQKQNYCHLGPLSAELKQLFKLGKFYGAAECNWDMGNNTGTWWK